MGRRSPLLPYADPTGTTVARHHATEPHWYLAATTLRRDRRPVR